MAYHDKAAISLPPLKMGKQVRLQKDGIWKRAKVIEVFNSPRIYVVETPNGAICRRKRVNLHTDKSTPAQQPSAEAHPRSSEQDTPEAYDSPDTTPAKKEEPHASGSSDGYRTRSGRLINRPKKLGFDERFLLIE